MLAKIILVQPKYKIILGLYFFIAIALCKVITIAIIFALKETICYYIGEQEGATGTAVTILGRTKERK